MQETTLVIVGIPVLDRLDLTQSIIGLLRKHGGWDQIHVYDNGSLAQTTDWLEAQQDISWHDCKGWWFYRMWNAAWAECDAIGGQNDLVLLNNDITFGAGFLQGLVADLRANPEWGMACPRQGMPGSRCTVMTGFAFAVKAELEIPRFNEGYRIYGGDYEFARTTVDAGYEIGWSKNVKCWHEGSATLKDHPDLLQAGITQDEDLWRERWNTEGALL